MTKTIAGLALALLVTGCASVPPSEPEPVATSRPQPKIPEGSAYLGDGPTVGLEGAAAPRRKTTLQLLEERDQEITRLNEQLKELEKSMEMASARERAATHEAAQSTGEFHRLRDMLEISLSEQKDLTENLLAARIARLRSEQEMIRLKLADLAKDSQ